MYEQWGKVTSTEVAEDVAKAGSSNYYIHPSSSTYPIQSHVGTGTYAGG